LVRLRVFARLSAALLAVANLPIGRARRQLGFADNAAVFVEGGPAAGTAKGTPFIVGWPCELSRAAWVAAAAANEAGTDFGEVGRVG
jgi:hypothetical protein